MNDPNFEKLSEAWIHLTAFQKQMIVWRAWIMSIKNRAYRFIQKLTGG
jgi:hypothetical protein